MGFQRSNATWTEKTVLNNVLDNVNQSKRVPTLYAFENAIIMISSRTQD